MYRVSDSCQLTHETLPRSIVEKFADSHGGGCITLDEAFVIGGGAITVFDAGTGEQLRRVSVPFDVSVWWPELLAKNNRVYTFYENKIFELNADRFVMVCQTTSVINSLVIVEHTTDFLKFYYQSGTELNLVTRRTSRKTRRKRLRQKLFVNGIALLIGAYENRLFAFTISNDFAVIEDGRVVWKFPLSGVLLGAINCGVMVYMLVDDELYVVNTINESVGRGINCPLGNLVLREVVGSSV